MKNVLVLKPHIEPEGVPPTLFSHLSKLRFDINLHLV